MTALKSNFTFIVKDGKDFEFELEPFYLNTKSHTVEPLSPSSRTTPRDLKKPFGPINKVMKIDDKIIKIENQINEVLYLEVDRLSPMLDKDDTRLKAQLINLKNEETEVLVKLLNDLVSSFHSEENRRSHLDHEEIKHQATLPLPDLVDSKESKSLLDDIEISNSSQDTLSCGGRKLSVKYSYEGSTYSLSQATPRKRAQDQGNEKQVKRIKLDESEDEVEELKVKDNAEHKFEDEEEEEDRHDIDITAYAENIISGVKYKGINSDMLQVPACLKVDHDKVENLKSLLVSTPDKTMTWCGAVVVLDKERQKQITPFLVYVNPEIFVALKQLASEGRIDTDIIPVAVHVVNYNDPIDHETLGLFLNNNAKNFSEQLHDKLLYQDILRFVCSTVANESKVSSEGVKVFIKKTLRGMAKGAQNVTMFLKFAELPVEYLNNFEDFLRQFESGSLAGQNLSNRKIRNIDRNGKRKKICKVEVPLNLLKLHLKVSQSLRESLLSKLMSRSIEFAEYSKKIKDAGEVEVTKKAIENISKKTFEEVKQSAPAMFEDQVLVEFGGVKSNATGTNRQRDKLINHINKALQTNDEEVPVEQFVSSDHLNFLALGRKFKEFDVIVLNCGEKNKDQEFCLMEHIKDNKETVGVVIKGGCNTRDDILAAFDDKADVVVVNIYIKAQKPIVIDGIKNDIVPVVLVGHRDHLKDKEVKNFHSFKLEQALQFVLSDIVSSKAKVLFSFSELENGFDIDLLGLLKRKLVSISYLAQQKVLSDFEERIRKRIK